MRLWECGIFNHVRMKTGVSETESCVESGIERFYDGTKKKATHIKTNKRKDYIKETLSCAKNKKILIAENTSRL